MSETDHQRQRPWKLNRRWLLSRVKASASDKQFYLIAGAFKGNRQANVLLEEMKKKGYDDAIIIEADQYSKKVKVAVEGFEMKEMLTALRQNLKKS